MIHLSCAKNNSTVQKNNFRGYGVAESPQYSQAGKNINKKDE
jgi:hypothetical protein